jgi:hypothetical protein
MLIREQAPSMRPGAYLIGVAPGAADLEYVDLGQALAKALDRLQLP